MSSSEVFSLQFYHNNKSSIELLRFLYCNEIDLHGKPLTVAFELLDFADKYLQGDLNDRCLEYLRSNINSKTALPIFEEASARNLQNLMPWCVERLKNNITLTNVSELVQSLISKYSHELRDKVFDWILKNYFEIYQKQNKSLRLFEEFLTKNIGRKTIGRIFQFIVGAGGSESFIKSYKSYKKNLAGLKVMDSAEHHPDDYDEEESMELNVFEGEFMFLRREKAWIQKQTDEALENEAKEIFEQETMKLRGRVYCFKQENWKEIKQGPIAKDLPKDFLMEVISFLVETPNLNEKNARGRKRNVPIQEDHETAENPELKKDESARKL